jgi:hypothetical protein
MFANLLKLLRPIVAALLLGFAAAPVAEAGLWGTEPRPTAVGQVSDEPRGDPARGVLWLAIGAGLVVFFVWVAIRIGDPSRPADKVPN